MVFEMRYVLALFAALLFSSAAIAQVSTQASTGIPAPMLYGSGTPDTNYACNASTANLTYIQTDASTGRLWICDNSTGALAWEHLMAPFLGSATSGTITGGAFILGGCTATTTVTVSGATVGVNSALAAPIWATAPVGNMGLFNLTAWVSAANTVTIQGCAIGVLGSVPSFKAKVFLY